MTHCGCGCYLYRPLFISEKQKIKKVVSTKINRIYRLKYFSVFERKSWIFFNSVKSLKCTLILLWRIVGVICIVFKVGKIVKGSLDSIPSPSRSREHFNFLVFIFFLQNIAGRCQQTFLPLHLKPTFQIFHEYFWIPLKH